MLTWTSVVTDAPDDQELAAAIARRTALEIRPLIEFAPLRRAMGLEVVAEVEAAPTRAKKPSAKRPAAKRTTARSPKRHRAAAAVAA